MPQTPAREWLLSQIFDSSVDAIIVIDEAGTIVEWNSQSESMFGWQKHEAMGRPIHETVIPERLRAKHIGGIERYLKTGESHILEQRLEVLGVQKSGLEFPAELTVTGHAVEGTRRFTAFIRNLTEQKQLEAKLLEGERQFAHLSRLRILGELASGIAHELNQPLNAISVLSSLAEMTDDPAELKQALLKIGTFTDRAGELIKHFRNLSSANEQTRSPSNINELIQRAVQFLDNEITHHGVSLEFRLAPDLPELEIVPIEIEQITLNLVQNALEAMADQSTPSICITTEHNSENLTVSVTNSGAVELDDNIFEAFKTTKSNGLGIGLTVCRSNIENHGGRIWLESAPDNTTFRFSLPLSL